MSGTIRVHVRAFGEDHSFVTQTDGATLLEAARDQGIDLPSSCEAGSCATCRAKLTAGQVELRNNLILDDAELAAGYVLVCQALPVAGDIALDFDA